DERGKCQVWVVENGESRSIDPRFDLFNHSPTGFEWGYGGSGPAQLALAILADALGNDLDAMRLHQRYKFKVIDQLHGDWQISRVGGRPAAAELRGRPWMWTLAYNHRREAPIFGFAVTLEAALTAFAKSWRREV